MIYQCRGGAKGDRDDPLSILRSVDVHSLNVAIEWIPKCRLMCGASAARDTTRTCTRVFVLGVVGRCGMRVVRHLRV